MLKQSSNPEAWRMACAAAFQQPMGGGENPRRVNATCVNFDKDIVEFENIDSDFHFDIPTELFAMIPHIGAQVIIDPVHYIVRFMPGYGAPIVDLITGSPRSGR